MMNIFLKPEQGFFSSIILKINGWLQIVRKFFSSLGSRVGILRRGKMTALLTTWADKPELNEALLTAVREGRILL